MVELRALIVFLMFSVFSVLLIGCETPFIDINVTAGGSNVVPPPGGGGACRWPTKCPRGGGAAPRLLDGTIAEVVSLNGGTKRFYFINNVKDPNYDSHDIFELEVPPGQEISDKNDLIKGALVQINTFNGTITLRTVP